jgi:hypothetical protein
MHWVATAKRPPTDAEFREVEEVDVFDLWAEMADATPKHQRAFMAVAMKYAQVEFVKDRVREIVYPTVERFRSLTKGRDAMPSAPLTTTKEGNVRAHLPTFSGVSRAMSPLSAVRAIHTWIVSARTAAELQLHDARGHPATG